jgi:lipoate-protein ligase A
VQGTPSPDPPVVAYALSVAGVDLTDREPPIVRVETVRAVAVVLPRSRDPEREVYLERCRRDRVPVVKRPTGGGAVVLAPGVVAASALGRARAGDRFPEAVFRRYCAAVGLALADVGVAGVEQRGVSDLCLGDRKIAGSSLRLFRDRVLFQVSVLVDVDVGLLQRYLPMPSRAPGYRVGRSHRDFVLNLREAGFPASRAGLADALRRRLAGAAAGPVRLHGDGASV